MLLTKALRLALVGAVAIQAAPFDVIRQRELTFPYGSEKVRGVNLGGWFVLEPWITPSLFGQFKDNSVVDEYHLCQRLGKAECESQLSAHWASFYNEKDFQDIARAGLNHVRIPIGYWAVSPLDGDPYVQGQIQYLDQALGWAQAAGLKVWIDLHGAPGSQNGFDNSGIRGQIEWQTGSNVAITKDVIRALASKYAQSKYNNVVVAIQLLNEPLGPDLNMDEIRQYWMDGWGTVRDYGDIAVVIHDAFTAEPSDWNGFMTTGWNNVILDTHQYQVFNPSQLALSIDEHVQAACNIGRNLQTVDKWTVVGEWTGARTDCAEWLNGVGIGVRYDGTYEGSSYIGSCDGRVTGSVGGFSDDQKKQTRKYIEAQLDAYEQGAGWIFWTWKTEQGAPEWDMSDLIGVGLFPQPLTQRTYGNQCGF